MDAKDQLLDEVSTVIVPHKRFGIRYFVSTLLVMALILLTLFPKVFLQTQIYYKSREIATLKREYKLLKEENVLISRKVESMKFKNQILDTLF